MALSEVDRRRRRILKVISLVLGGIAAVFSYVIYLPMMEQLKSMIDAIPDWILKMFPVDNWYIVPYAVGAFYFFLVSMTIYWISVLVMRVFRIEKKAAPAPIS
ncbi:MAG TPA: hypothetical protein VFS65_01555 [Candidatus Saccharimonadales bacterium]|nr:hypothetical protein [Candidatus Saccharimonadales bacterium]